MPQGTDLQYADPGWLCENGRSGGAGDDGAVKNTSTGEAGGCHLTGIALFSSHNA